MFMKKENISNLILIYHLSQWNAIEYKEYYITFLLGQTIFASQTKVFHVHCSWDVQMETLVGKFSVKAVSLDL